MKISSAIRYVFALLLFTITILFIYIVNIYVEIAVTKILPEGTRRNIVVDRGIKVRNFSKKLEELGLVSSSTHFTVAYISQHPSKTLQAGLYEINESDTLLDLVEKIARGASLMEKMTFVEGWEWQQIKHKMRSDKQFINHNDQDILSFVNKRFAHRINGNRNFKNIEGLMMPDTYKFKRGIQDLTIISEAVERQVSFLEKAWKGRDRTTNYKNPYQALIVASLIEKESRYPPEYAKISAVILNRINKKIPIQIDASVIYGLGKHQNRLFYSDLRKPTPYNMYMNKGLPPTPISMPSKKAIIAALHPHKFDALFYVLNANKSNQHIFTNNFKDHLAAKNNNKIG